MWRHTKLKQGMQSYAYRQRTQFMAHYSNPTVFTASWISSFASAALLIPAGTDGCQLATEKRVGAAATVRTQSFTAETARPSGAVLTSIWLLNGVASAPSCFADGSSPIYGGQHLKHIPLLTTMNCTVEQRLTACHC